jgi:hypothetical protein
MENSMDSIHELALEIFEALDTPRSLSCAILLRNGELSQLSSLKLNPLDYLDAWSYKTDAQATSLLKKREVDDPSLIELAKETWLQDEKWCAKTNIRMTYLQSLVDYPLYDADASDEATRHLVLAIRKKIKKVIGRTPPIELIGRFGPGATFQHTSQSASLFHKLVGLPELTERCRYVTHLVNSTAWFRYHAGDNFFDDNSDDGSFDSPVVRGNRWTSVPKDTLKRRSIAIEPTLNLFLQLGVGEFLKGRLSKQGLLLRPSGRSGVIPYLQKSDAISESQLLHRRWAREASISGDYATLDLSSASDTICLEFVRLVLPPAWFQFLSDIRSPTTTVDGKIFLLEKFSSMGNGFTFELETLLFWAVCEACGELIGSGGASSCYGDDIIVPESWVPTVLAALRLFGFKVNLNKSFVIGPFRESCGGDYFNGIDVRPVQIKVTPTSPPEWVTLHNLLVRINDFWPIPRALNTVRGMVPTLLRRCGGPRELGDLVFHDTTPNRRWNRSTWSYDYRVILTQNHQIPFNRIDERAQVVAALYGVPSSGCLTRQLVGYRTAWVSFH